MVPPPLNATTGKPASTLRIYSWNVNGLRAAASKGLLRWLRACGGSVVCLQETRACDDQIQSLVRIPKVWRSHFVAAERPGYSGVGLLARWPWSSLDTSLGDPEIDREGRLQIARFGPLWVVNGYFPNGSGKARDNSRVPFKLAFYRRLFDALEPARSDGTAVIVVGDFNTAHQEIDLARPRQNAKTSGFLPEEREELSRWLRAGWIDTFRRFQPGPGHYTWWSQRSGVREKNVGWRIDYALASPGAAPYVTGAGIEPHVTGSDHCPVFVDMNPAVLSSDHADCLPTADGLRPPKRSLAIPTGDGRHVVIDGRRWRASNPSLPEGQRQELVRELMAARREVGRAKRVGDEAAVGVARGRVHAAKVALGERGPAWWTVESGTGDKESSG